MKKIESSLFLDLRGKLPSLLYQQVSSQKEYFYRSELIERGLLTLDLHKVFQPVKNAKLTNYLLQKFKLYTV